MDAKSKKWNHYSTKVIKLLIFFSLYGICYGFSNQETQQQNNYNGQQQKDAAFYFLQDTHLMNSLNDIHDINNENIGTLCTGEQNYRYFQIGFDTKQFFETADMVDLISDALEISFQKKGDKNIMTEDSSRAFLLSMIKKNTLVTKARILTMTPDVKELSFTRTSGSNDYNSYESAKVSNQNTKIVTNITNHKKIDSYSQLPWFDDSLRIKSLPMPQTKFMLNKKDNSFLPNNTKGWWTHPYYLCEHESWLISYISPINEGVKENGEKVPLPRIAAVLAIDLDISKFDINQCDGQDGEYHEGGTADQGTNTIKSFQGTHKCHRNTTKCIFMPGNGWKTGSYECRCKNGYFSKNKSTHFNGSLVEVAYKDKKRRNTASYDDNYKCIKCQEGCDSCVDSSPCLATYHWGLRYVILCISLFCTSMSFVIVLMVYKYRKLKVFSLASPTFLCITLFGCAIMYLEMLAIFPTLDTYCCIATKWTRYLGMYITYSALLMKTWRVSLTFRVKSAYKLKITDKQLLQWLVPILLVMLTYLSTWTISDPPKAVDITDQSGLKYKQCDYGWWDHCVVGGQALFLLWGVKICISVRKARTFFNEARYIRWSIYNIVLVNSLMLAIHLSLFPNVGPDMKYFIQFIRTQLSTTGTIILVFGPKFYRVYMGTANDYDDHIRARGANASIVGEPFGTNETKDMFLENQELKEEVQKLAGQIQYIKIVGMLMDNRHIREKKEGYFSRDHFAKQIASASDRSNRKSSTIMTAHFLDGKVVTAGEATKVVSPLPSTTKNEPPIPLSQMTSLPNGKVSDMTCTNCYQSIQSIPLKEYNQLQDPEDSYKNIDVHDIVHPDSASCSKRNSTFGVNSPPHETDCTMSTNGGCPVTLCIRERSNEGSENHELMPLKCSKHPSLSHHQPKENAVVDVSGREAPLRNIRSDSVVEDSLSSSLTKSPTSTTLKSDDDLLRLLENNSAEI